MTPDPRRWIPRSSGSDGEPAAVSGQGRWNRNLRLARLGMRGAGRFALVKARKTFASAERKVELNHDFQLATAADVTRELGQMKGALMKIGQMASYVDSGLPDHVRSTMASLQNNAPPMTPNLSAETVEAELGKHPEALFQEWDPEPIAAASIGQVHRAITWDDRAVAVKVQYPGVAEAVAADLGNADWIFSAMGSVFPGLQTGPVIDELRDRLIEELDYENEARNQRYYAQFFDRHPFVSVPDVVDHLSTSRILTTDLATGADFAEVATWSNDERNAAAECVFRFSFGSIYRLHAFNGDPHPGNYLFNPGGKVTFLDFGLVKRFDTTETAMFEQVIRSMVLEQDAARFRRVVEGAGLVPPNAPFTDAEIRHYFSFYYQYLLEDEVVTLDEAYSAGGVAHLFGSGPEGDRTPAQKAASARNAELVKILNVPPSFVILQRITLGLMGLLARLEATNNWRRIAEELWPFVAGEPSTPMGAEIEAWRRARNQSRFGI